MLSAAHSLCHRFGQICMDIRAKAYMSYTIFTVTSVSHSSLELVKDVSLTLGSSRFGQICITVRRTPYIGYPIYNLYQEDVGSASEPTRLKDSGFCF